MSEWNGELVTDLEDHTDCGTEECCGTCEPTDEQEVRLSDATMEQATEAAIDLMHNIMDIQANLGMHLDVLNQVSLQLEELGAKPEDIKAMAFEALRRHGIPEEHIVAAMAEMEMMFAAPSLSLPPGTRLD